MIDTTERTLIAVNGCFNTISHIYLDDQGVYRWQKWDMPVEVAIGRVATTTTGTYLDHLPSWVGYRQQAAMNAWYR